MDLYKCKPHNFETHDPAEFSKHFIDDHISEFEKQAQTNRKLRGNR